VEQALELAVVGLAGVLAVFPGRVLVDLKTAGQQQRQQRDKE
jgi:hypothetical protein